MNTGQMVFELQGSVGELKEAVANLSRKIEQEDKRLEMAERSHTEIKDALRTLAPKIDNLVGFTAHATPHFATKADIAGLTTEIQKRPTRGQAVRDLAMIVGAIAAALAIGAHFALPALTSNSTSGHTSQVSQAPAASQPAKTPSTGK